MIIAGAYLAERSGALGAGLSGIRLLGDQTTVPVGVPEVPLKAGQKHARFRADIAKIIGPEAGIRIDKIAHVAGEPDQRL